MEKHYNPKDAEHIIYDMWEQAKIFQPNADKEPAYTIVIPPPNITGSLHMGHALNNTLQDILIRYHRMRGFNVLWQPGTDHASIATQMIVERRLHEQGKPDRHQLGRDKFLDEVWNWKEESGSVITKQLRLLGASCDWTRERFTMDKGLSEAVIHCFVSLYNDGLIYKDKRLVNWDPKMQTAISDLEVVSKDIEGALWYFRYPIDGQDAYIDIATTRPETMLGDVAIAVHPDDERYKDYIGLYAIQPITRHKLRIVGDDMADPEQGTGAVKITPAHDFNDFEVGKRHQLDTIIIFDEGACCNENTPKDYQGLDRFAARDKIITAMQDLGLFIKEEPHFHTVPYAERGGVPVEPLLTEQWFVNAEILAAPALASVKEGRTKLFPKTWENTYYHWLENIQPWCISRQLWWGHRIPAWYGDDGAIFVAYNEEEALQQARLHYGNNDVTLTQDDDVLDTWFSSALWPFSTLGWPENTDILTRHYPTDILVTGFDILFFWVARMMMMGLYFMKEEPFHTVYVHALVRDEHGQKMSKTKGNVINPTDLIDEFGADSLRFTLAALSTPGRDIKMAKGRIIGYRNFITKLWNSARYATMNDANFMQLDSAINPKHPVNHFILAEFNNILSRIDMHYTHYRFDEAANEIYHFVWDIFCDWYVELSKFLLQDEAYRCETQIILGGIIIDILKILHPMVPFVSEHLFQQLYANSHDKNAMLITASWPSNYDMASNDAKHDITYITRIINSIRSMKAEYTIPQSTLCDIYIQGANGHNKAIINAQTELLQTIGKVASIHMDVEQPHQAVRLLLDEASIYIPLANMIDIDSEKQKLKKRINALEKDITAFDKKLQNSQFLAKAKKEAIDDVQQKHAQALLDIERLQETYDALQ